MNELMDLKDAYERIEWQIKHDVENYDKDPTVAGIIDLERIKEAIDELQTHKQKEDKIREYVKQNTLWLDNINHQAYTIYDYNSYRIAIVEVDGLLQILNEGDK